MELGRERTKLRCGQATPEFIVIVGLIMFILLIVSVMYGEFSLNSQIAKEQMAASRAGHELAYAINAVAEGGDGSSYIAYISTDGSSNMSIGGRVVYMNYSRGIVTAPLTTNSTNAPSVIPVNTFLNISNSQGVISVTPM